MEKMGGGGGVDYSVSESWQNRVMLRHSRDAVPHRVSEVFDRKPRYLGFRAKASDGGAHHKGTHQDPCGGPEYTITRLPFKL